MNYPPTPTQIIPQSADVDWSAYEVPHPQPFVCSCHVEFDQLSQAIPHVSNVEYVRWLDRVAELHCDSLGFPRKRMLEDDIMWFVSRHEIDYIKEVWAEDDLLLATWIRDIRRVKSWREYVVIRPSDDSIVCRAATLWVLVDLKTRRPCRHPSDMMKILTEQALSSFKIPALEP